MRYTNRADAQLMRRRAMDPSILARRQHLGALTDIGKGSTAASAAAGASTGAAIGSYVPVIGTAIGALVGGAVGAIMSSFNRQDKENLNFQQAQNMANQLGAQSVLDINNKYLVLAGLFDLEPSQIKGNIPIYKKYGRMGEFRFVTDMCMLIQQAANSGVINASDTPQSVYNKVVLPWINGFGFGGMSDSNANMITTIIVGMIAEYCANIFTQRWYAVGGQMPFGSLPPFSLPQAAAPVTNQVTGSPTPSPQSTLPTVYSTTTGAPTELQQYQAGTVPVQGGGIGYVKTVTGAFMQLPPGLASTFNGIDPATGAWIFRTGGVNYIVNGSGTITPWGTTQTVTTQANEQVSATDSSGQSVPAQYIPSGGGGGGYYPTPAPVPVTTAAAVSSGLTISPTAEIGIAGAVVVGLVLLMMKGHHGK